MAVINTNVKALFSQAALKSTERSQSVAMQQLSTGKRINSARDDAAGMAIATRMTHQIRSLNQAVRNAGDAISLIQTAEGATNEITDMMQRMRELAIQAVNDTNSNPDRSYLDLEFQQLKQEIVRISDSTEWNGFKVLNGTAGERVGEMPLFKVTSENQFGSVFIDPTTSRTLNGRDGGQQQTLTFAGTATTKGDLIVGGVRVPVEIGDTYTDIANKVQLKLSNDDSFGPSSGRNVSVSSSGVVTISFAASEGPVADVQVENANIIGIPSPVVATTRQAIASSTENFKEGGSFLKSGSLKITTDTSTAASEKNKVTFKTLGVSESVTVGGLTFTSGSPTPLAASDVAAAFSSLANDPSNVAFTSSIAAGDVVTIAGLTLTAGAGGISDVDLAKAFSGLNDGVTNPSFTPANASWTGKFSGFSSPAYTAGATSVNFTMSPNSTTIAPISATGTALTLVVAGTTNGTWTGSLAGYSANHRAGNDYVDFTSTNPASDVTDLTTSTTGIPLTVSNTPAYPGDVIATFLTESGESIPMSGKLNTTAVTESAKITFNDVTTGQTVSVGGLNFTATQNATAAQVAASFGALTDNATSGADSTYGTWSGRFTGFTTGYTAGNAYISATSTTASTNVQDITVTSTGNMPAVEVNNGAPASSISFYKNSGSNAEIISSDLIYTFTDPNGAAALGNRKFTYSVDVAGKIPSLRAGDLKINGIEIGASYAQDDPFSPANNASGSAIAKAAAINRMANATGITRGESQMLTISGTPSPGTIVVGGVSVTLDALDNTSAKATAKIAILAVAFAEVLSSASSVTLTPPTTIVPGLGVPLIVSI